MRKPLSTVISMLLLVFLVPAGASAADFQAASQLADQVRTLEDMQFAAQDEITARIGSRKILREHAAAAQAQLPALNSRLQVLANRTDQSRSKLNQMTARYIDLVRQLGQDPNSPAQESEQQLVQYLSTSRMHDAALVFQLSSAILNQQAGVLSQLRQQAALVQKQETALQNTQAKRRAKIYAAQKAVEDNEARIAELSGQVSQRAQTLSGLQRQLSQKLAIQQSEQGGGILTVGQVQFSYQLASLSGMDVNVIKAWVLAEMSAGYARDRQRKNNHNWLNIGYFDSLGGGGAFQKGRGSSVWSDPISAANASEAFLEGKIFGASPGIQNILLYAGASPGSQIDAIASSGWASSGYGGGSSLRGTYNLVPHSKQPPRIQIRWRSPKDGKTYLLGKGYGL